MHVTVHLGPGKQVLLLVVNVGEKGLGPIAEPRQRRNKENGESLGR